MTLPGVETNEHLTASSPITPQKGGSNTKHKSKYFISDADGTTSQKYFTDYDDKKINDKLESENTSIPNNDQIRI